MLVFTMLICWGADIVGTVARCFWFHFVFRKVPQRGGDSEDKHNRTKISTKGFQDVFYKTIKFATYRENRAISFRSGTGNVSLGMSTIQNYNAIDFNPRIRSGHSILPNSTKRVVVDHFRLVCG